MSTFNNLIAQSVSADSATSPKFSICMANLNMVDFIEASILSIYNQLSEQFEIVVVDGGSDDGSLEILQRLEKELDRIRLIALDRDQKRKLGTDRNISIENARGEYVLLHLDCDDLYLPYIQDWVEVFLSIEAAYGPDILVAGEQINMGRKSFLLSHGPYKNLHFEDRELWTRLAKIGSLIKLQHAPIRTRMKIPQPARTIKVFKRNYVRILEDLQQPQNRFFKYCWTQISQKNNLGFKLRLFRVGMCWLVLPHYICAGKTKTDERHDQSENIEDFEKKSLRALLCAKGIDEKTVKLSPSGRSIFFD